MSVNIGVTGGLQKPASTRLTTSGQTDVYTAASDGETVVAITLANETASATIVLIERFDGTTNFNTFRRSVPADDTVVLSDFPIRLRNGHKIRATAATGNRITVNVDVVLDSGKSQSGGGPK